jgi:hypothetical protein
MAGIAAYVAAALFLSDWVRSNAKQIEAQRAGHAFESSNVYLEHTCVPPATPCDLIGWTVPAAKTPAIAGGV